MKKLIAVLLCTIMLALVPVSAMAEVEVNPRLTYIASAEGDLIINGTTAIVDCWVKGNYGDATKAKVIAELQLKSGSSWMAYGTWTNTQNNYEAYVYETKTVKKGQTYRVKVTATVWEGSQSETITFFTDEATV